MPYVTVIFPRRENEVPTSEEASTAYQIDLVWMRILVLGVWSLISVLAQVTACRVFFISLVTFSGNTLLHRCKWYFAPPHLNRIATENVVVGSGGIRGSKYDFLVRPMTWTRSAVWTSYPKHLQHEDFESSLEHLIRCIRYCICCNAIPLLPSLFRVRA